MHKLNCMFGQGKVGGKSSTVFNLPSYTFPLLFSPNALAYSHVAFAQKFPFCVFPFWNENIFVSLLSALFVGEMKENARGECLFCFFFPLLLVHLVCCLFYDFVGGTDEAAFSPPLPEIPFIFVVLFSQFKLHLFKFR